jgi:hemerythrin superfamily protein
VPIRLIAFMCSPYVPVRSGTTLAQLVFSSTKGSDMDKQNTTNGLSAGLQKFKKIFTGNEDIVSVIEQDHKPLKDLIPIMKDSDRPFAEREQAFMEFAPLLMTHAKSEEKSLYDFLKTQKEFKAYAYEGETEHTMADQLCEEIKRASSEDEIGAKIKVLAESVEHHIQEEENDILPDVQAKIDNAQLIALTKIYIQWQEQIISEGQDDAPHESEIRGDRLHS